MKKYLKGFLSVSLILICVNFANTKLTNYVFNHTVAEKKEPVNDTIRGAEYNVTVTMYYAVAGQCDATPLITADGSKINPKAASEHKWIAVSQDMLKRNGGKIAYGDYVEVKGTKDQDGIYCVHDCMNKRFHNTIDILETAGTDGYKYKNISLTQISWKTSTQSENLLASL